jgi:hypothetical protein
MIKEIAKTSESDVYQSIIADLEYAKANLPMNILQCAIQSNKRNSCCLPCICLSHNWNDQGAYDEAKFVIDNKAFRLWING